MNLNDTNQYEVVIFKKKFFYKTTSKSIRDVFYSLTKDGTKPNLGIQEIMLFTKENFDKLPFPEVKREEIRKTASHLFSIRGYINNSKRK